MKISISTDFTILPGGRYYSDGDKSGQEFYDEILEKAFQKCLELNELLEVDLDGVYGYGSSFLEESFGGLSRKFGANLVLSLIRIKSDEDLSQVERVAKYIKEAGSKNETVNKE